MFCAAIVKNLPKKKKKLDRLVLVLVRLLGAPPTGGTHLESDVFWGGALRCLVCSESPLSKNTPRSNCEELPKEKKLVRSFYYWNQRFLVAWHQIP
jgi:hypothetical protein